MIVLYEAVMHFLRSIRLGWLLQRDEWIDMMFKPRFASPPRVAAPPQVPSGPPKPKKKNGKK